MTEFAIKVIATIRKIPRGRVATYSQIAALAGKPGAARGVVWILNSSSGVHGLPWHRVINAKGMIAFPRTSTSFRKQRALLLREKIAFLSPGAIDLKKHQWKKVAREKSVRGRAKPTPRMFS